MATVAVKPSHIVDFNEIERIMCRGASAFVNCVGVGLCGNIQLEPEVRLSRRDYQCRGFKLQVWFDKTTT